MLKRHGHSYFCAWPYCICICRSFPFRRKIYWRIVFKWITQWYLLTFALVQLLIFVPLFNAPKKHVKLFCARNGCNFVARRRHRREQRARGRRERIFSTHFNLFGMPEEHIIRTYSMPDHVIFNLLQEIKDDLEPSTRSHAIPRLLATHHFLAYRFLLMYCGVFISLFATTLICAALGILPWSTCKWDVASVFFNLRGCK